MLELVTFLELREKCLSSFSVTHVRLKRFLKNLLLFFNQVWNYGFFKINVFINWLILQLFFCFFYEVLSFQDYHTRTLICLLDDNTLLCDVLTLAILSIFHYPYWIWMVSYQGVTYQSFLFQVDLKQLYSTLARPWFTFRLRTKCRSFTKVIWNHILKIQFIHVYIYIYIYLSIYLFICLSIHLYLSICVYVIMKTMCPPDYHHNGFMATHTLGHMVYGYVYLYVYTYIYTYTYIYR